MKYTMTTPCDASLSLAPVADNSAKSAEHGWPRTGLSEIQNSPTIFWRFLSQTRLFRWTDLRAPNIGQARRFRKAGDEIRPNLIMGLCDLAGPHRVAVKRGYDRHVKTPAIIFVGPSSGATALGNLLAVSGRIG